MLEIKNIAEGNISAKTFGGKAYGLSLLQEAGYPIPKTLAIQATDSCEIINSSKFRKQLIEALSIFSKNDIYDLAVRSSCTLEDDFNNSMAGHFDSFLGVMTVDDVIINISKIIKGLEKADNKDGKMGIVIQNRIHSEYSGVLFSSNPITYSKKQSMISYVNESGEGLVSGKISGTDVIVNIDKNTYTIDDEIDTVLKGNLILLAQESKQLENRLKYPLDIEWSIEDTKIVFLQCRPLTNITSIHSVTVAVNEQNLAQIPAQLLSHDKINLRLMAQASGIFISDAYMSIKNTCYKNTITPHILQSQYCRGYSAVIVYPQRLENKVIRSFVGDKHKVYESVNECCRYGIRAFPEHDNLSTCLNNFSDLCSDEYWISATIVQEIFDPLYTGVIQRIAEGFIIEITRGHFLTKGIVPTSQYIVSKDGTVLERAEVNQEMWLKIIEGHIVQCICNNEPESLVTVDDKNVKCIIDNLGSILKTETTVVEFGLLDRSGHALEPYLIDFVDENAPINITSEDIKSGIISYGMITGKPVIINNVDTDSLNEHFHNVSETSPQYAEKVIFFCRRPELALLSLLDEYEAANIGFVFEECAIGAHLAVVLREKRIPAIKVKALPYGSHKKNICTLDAKTVGLSPKERIKYGQI